MDKNIGLTNSITREYLESNEYDEIMNTYQNMLLELQNKRI